MTKETLKHANNLAEMIRCIDNVDHVVGIAYNVSGDVRTYPLVIYDRDVREQLRDILAQYRDKCQQEFDSL